jgi:acyl-CoA thioester hydrolase
MEPVDRFLFRRRVEFAETDAAGIMHFSHFFRFMESAEHAFYRSLGFSVHDFRPKPGEPAIGWPRVHVEADFRLPLEFEEVVEVELLVEEVRSKSIRYQFRFWKDPDGERALAATGAFAVVCVRMNGEDGKMTAAEIPGVIRRSLRAVSVEELRRNRV